MVWQIIHSETGNKKLRSGNDLLIRDGVQVVTNPFSISNKLSDYFINTTKNLKKLVNQKDIVPEDQEQPGLFQIKHCLGFLLIPNHVKEVQEVIESFEKSSIVASVVQSQY